MCLLLQAIRSDNPIIFFEHVLLYNIKGDTHDGDYCQSLEKCEVRRAAGCKKGLPVCAWKNIGKAEQQRALPGVCLRRQDLKEHCLVFVGRSAQRVPGVYSPRQ